MGLFHGVALGLYRGLTILQLHRYMRTISKDKTIILMYHGFTDKDSHEGLFNYHGKHLSTRRLRSQLNYLKKNHTIISLNEYIELRSKGKKTPPNSVVITIDDGYASIFTHAYPLFKEFQVPATVFLVSNFINKNEHLWVDRLEFALDSAKNGTYSISSEGFELLFTLDSKKSRIATNDLIRARLKKLNQNKRMSALEMIESELGCALQGPSLYEPLSWKQINEMRKSGLISFGAHTKNHVILTKCSEKELADEINGSNLAIEKKTLSKITTFSYPNGRYNEGVKQAVQKKHKGAVSTHIGFNSDATDVFELKRFNIRNEGDLSEFLMTMYGVIDGAVQFLKKN